MLNKAHLSHKLDCFSAAVSSEIEFGMEPERAEIKVNHIREWTQRLILETLAETFDNPILPNPERHLILKHAKELDCLDKAIYFILENPIPEIIDTCIREMALAIEKGKMSSCCGKIPKTTLALEWGMCSKCGNECDYVYDFEFNY